MRSLACVFILSGLLAGCGGGNDVPCLENANCNLAEGGLCTVAETGNQWCTYPDDECEFGRRWSDLDVEGVLSGKCVDGPMLTVHLGGKGTGGAFSNPAGLRCEGDTCNGQFREDSVVQLTAETTTDSFLGWIDGCRGNGTCALTMDTEHSVTALFGIPNEALWATQLGASEVGIAGRVAMDKQGNLIAPGGFIGTFALGANPPLQSAGAADGFVAKLATSTGTPLWVKRLGGTLEDFAIAAAVDDFGDVYIVGQLHGNADLGDGPKEAEGTDGFVLKLGANGDFRWATRITGTGTAFTRVVAVNEDAVVVAGPYDGALRVDTQTSTSVNNSNDFYVLKLSAATGARMWLRTFGGSNIDSADGIALDGDGNAVVAGFFNGTLNFTGGSLSATGVNEAMFLIKLSPDGAPLFAKRFEGAGNVRAQNVEVDAANQIVVVGHHDRGSDAANLGCTSSISGSLFVVQYTPTGECVWGQGFVGSGSFLDVDINSVGEIAASGRFEGAASFGGEILTSSDADDDIFAVRLANDGAHLSSMRAGGQGYDEGSGIALGPDGRLFVTGQFSNRAEFRGESLMPARMSDGFITAHAPF